MKNRRNFWMYSLLLMAVLLVFVNSCAKDDDIEQEPVDALSEKAVIIDNTDWQNSIISRDTVNNTFTFNDNIEDMDLEIGSIIVSAADEGILRKVSEISDEEGTIIVQTDNADLEDVIENGEFVIEQPLTVSDLNRIDYHYKGISLNPSSMKQMNNTNFLWDFDAVIHENGTGEQIKLVGQFNCSWDINMNIKIRWFKLKTVRIGFEASENFDLALIASCAYELEKSIPLMTVRFNKITVYIAGCPVVVTPVLEIKAGISGYAEANIETSISQELSFEAGIEYNKGQGWSTYETSNDSFMFSPPELNASVGAKAFLGPELSLEIYGVPGPYVDAQLYSRIEADVLNTPPDPWWTLYGGLDIGVGAKVKKFGKTLVNQRYDGLIKFEKILAQSTTPAPELPIVSSTVITNITETSASGGGNITDDGGSSITERGVLWSHSENGDDPPPDPTIDANSGLTTDGSGAGSFVSNISGLTPNTWYYVRAYATNSNETTGYGDVISFNTLSIPVIPVLSTSDITGITETTALSGGNITDNGGAPVIARGVCWIKKETGQEPTEDDNKTSDGTGAGSFVSNISGLAANTRYSVRAYATNSTGTGYGNTEDFTTEGGYVEVTLNNVNPDIGANQTWTESGVILSLQEYSGNTAFGIQDDGIWLFPCLLHADLSGLQGTVSEVQVDINDGCGENCTEAKLYDGDVEIATESNTSTGVHTLILTSDSGNIPDVLTVSSHEGQVLEIRITLQPN